MTIISPGFVRTNFAEGVTSPEVKAQLAASRDKFAMPPDAIARAIAFAIEQPADIDVNEIVIRPTAQGVTLPAPLYTEFDKIGCMPICLFCRKVCEKPSSEHVFPAALGGNLTVEGGACTGCNNGFSKMEQALAGELAPIRFILQIPDRYGNVPQVAAEARTEGKEYAARVRSDGTVVLKPLITEERDESGRREFVHRFLTDEQKERLKQQAAESGHQLIETGPGDPERAEIHIGGDLRVIGSGEGLRAVAKMAYVGLAYRTGVKLALSDAFTEVRDYIRDGTGKPLAALFVHEGFLHACQQGPHQHALIIAGRRDKKRVDAIVRLFGGLCYFVTLSDHYEGADFCDTVIYDAYRGEMNGMLLAHEQAELLQTEEVATSKDTVWGDLAESGKRFCEFLDGAIQAKMAQNREAAKTSV